MQNQLLHSPFIKSCPVIIITIVCLHLGVRSLEPYITLSVEDKILKRNNADLMQYMNMPVLLPYLYQNDLVTQEEYQILSRDSPTTFDKHGYFLQSVLPHKSPGAFDRLLCCFKAETQHCGHKYLAELLEKERQKSQQAQLCQSAVRKAAIHE